jgi:hypothetical protein
LLVKGRAVRGIGLVDETSGNGGTAHDFGELGEVGRREIIGCAVVLDDA